MSVLTGAIVTGLPHQPHADWIRIDDGLISAMGTGRPDAGAAPAINLGADLIVPGLVDLHCHGGAGASYSTTDHEQAKAVADWHLRQGSTTTMASLVTAPLEVLAAQVRTLRPLVLDGTLAGIHLEGPWLAAQHRGAHDPGLLRPPAPADLQTLAPGRTVRWPLGESANLVSSSEQQPFTVTIDGRGPHGPLQTLRYVVDLADYRESIAAPPGTLHELTRAVNRVVERLPKRTRS